MPSWTVSLCLSFILCTSDCGIHVLLVSFFVRIAFYSSHVRGQVSLGVDMTVAIR